MLSFQNLEELKEHFESFNGKDIALSKIRTFYLKNKIMKFINADFNPRQKSSWTFFCSETLFLNNKKFNSIQVNFTASKYDMEDKMMTPFKLLNIEIY